ncbi:MAG TPA: hypothetical protein VGJ22_10500 [Anaerolineales bacterium]
MTAEAGVRQALKAWIVETSGKISADELAGDTPIIERRIISSLQIMDLILFIEELSGRSIDVEQLKVGVFRNIDAIYHNFFVERTDGP